MTQQHFLAALDEELRRRRAQFKHHDLEKFVKNYWPAIERDPDVTRWSREFLDAGGGSVTV
jgi:hypothetical protein